MAQLERGHPYPLCRNRKPDPDSQNTAVGGFNPTSTPPGGNLHELDPVFYHGGVDFVVRVSRSYSVWFPATDPSTGEPFADGVKFNLPVVEPRPEDQPGGTEIVLSFRGTPNITSNECNNGVDGCDEFEALHNAQTLDGYGDHYYRPTNPMVSPPGTIPQFRPTAANKGIEGLETGAGLDTDDEWREIDLVSPNPEGGILGIDGNRYYQIRLTFLSNPLTGLSPELSAVALSWQE